MAEMKNGKKFTGAYGGKKMMDKGSNPFAAKIEDKAKDKLVKKFEKKAARMSKRKKM